MAFFAANRRRKTPSDGLSSASSEPAIALHAADAADTAAILRIERAAGREASVGRSDAAEHRAMLGDRRDRNLVATGADATARAFAIPDELDDSRILYLGRFAVDEAGRGADSVFLARVVPSALAGTEARRVRLDCFADNVRAQGLYEKLAFMSDGVLREAYRMPDGRGATSSGWR